MIVGSTGRPNEIGAGRLQDLLAAHDAAIRRELERRRGREVDIAGDALLAVDGTACAVGMRRLAIGGRQR